MRHANHVSISAAKCGHADVFDVFAKTGVSLRQPSSKIGMTALHIAGGYTVHNTNSRKECIVRDRIGE